MTDQPSMDLPGLQRLLDTLYLGDHLTISRSDYRRLFGIDDVALSRLTHFAEGHHCAFEPGESSITFRKAAATRP